MEPDADFTRRGVDESGDSAGKVVRMTPRVQPPRPPVDPDRMATGSWPFREHTLQQIAHRAKLEGVTQKTIVVRALRAMGVDVAPADLVERRPARRR